MSNNFPIDAAPFSIRCIDVPYGVEISLTLNPHGLLPSESLEWPGRVFRRLGAVEQGPCMQGRWQRQISHLEVEVVPCYGGKLGRLYGDGLLVSCWSRPGLAVQGLGWLR